MAKAPKSFSDKLNKKAADQTKMIRVIRSVQDPDTGGTRFLDNMTEIPSEGKVDEHVKNFLNKKA